MKSQKGKQIRDKTSKWNNERKYALNPSLAVFFKENFYNQMKNFLHMSALIGWGKT